MATTKKTATAPVAAAEAKKAEEHHHSGSVFGLIVGSLGIYVCYAAYGLAQERILTTPFGEKRDVYFKETTFLLFCQTVVNALAAGITVLVTGAKSTTSPLSFAPLGLVYILAMFSSNLSLQYIDYPSQVLGKSCKPLAVLLVGALVWRTVFPKVKYISVALITLGITLFMFQKVSGGHGAGGGAHGEDSNALLIGRLLIFGSLLCDGATGSLQDALVGKSRPSAYHLMFWNNAWAAVFLGVALLYTGRFQTGYQFALAYPEVLELILAFSITSAAGQMFIYYTVRHHGSLVCTMVTTTRKFFTILLSVVWFGHRLTDMQWLAVLIVFLGLAIDAFYSSKSKKKHD